VTETTLIRGSSRG